MYDSDVSIILPLTIRHHIHQTKSFVDASTYTIISHNVIISYPSLVTPELDD